MINSGGSIESSTFTNNYSNGNGGAIGIVNLSKDITIRNTYVTYNTASLGYGGGLAIYTDSN